MLKNFKLNLTCQDGDFYIFEESGSYYEVPNATLPDILVTLEWYIETLQQRKED